MNKSCFVSQRSVNDCAVASFNMILKLKGIDEKYENIKKKLKVDNEGASAYNIVKLSKKYGLTATGYKNYNICKTSIFPLIAHTINNELQHFVVVLSISNKHIHILDPASGDKKILIKDFNKIYTGISIVFKNTHLSYKSTITSKIPVIIFMILLLSVFSILYSYLLSYIVQSNKKYFLIIFILVALLKELIDYIKNKILLKNRIYTDKMVTTPTLKNILLLPLNYYQKNSTGEIISKINDLSYVKEMFYLINEVLFVNLFIIIPCLLLLSFISFRLFIINIIILLITFLFNKKFYKNNSYKNYDLQIKNEILNKNISDIISNVEVVKNLKKESYFIDKINSSYHELIDEYKNLSGLYINKNIINKLLGMVLLISSIYILRNNYFNILFITYIENIMLTSLYELCVILDHYSNYRASKKRLESIHQENISMYEGNKINIDSIVIKDITLYKGDMLFIEGETGSGKTTYFKKILNGKKTFYINGKKSYNYEINDITNSITYISQKSRLFNTSIINNITLGDKLNIKNNIYSKISKYLYKNGINEDYIVNNQNDNLSGGEVKLVLILQALNMNTDVIIFDETTNELDIKIERKIINILKNECKDKIFIFISHKNSNKDLFNRYLYFSSDKTKYNDRRINEAVKQKRIKSCKSRS